MVPRNWAFPATQRPKTGGPAKELSQTQAPTQACEAGCSGALRGISRLAQDCTATAQGCLLMAQVKTGSAQGLRTEVPFGEVIFRR